MSWLRGLLFLLLFYLGLADRQDLSLINISLGPGFDIIYSG